MTTVELADKIGFLQMINSFSITQLKKFARGRGFLECSHFTKRELINEFTFFFKTFTIDGRAGYKPPQYLDLVRPLVIDTIKNEENCVNVKIVLTCEMRKNIIGATLNNIPSVVHFLSDSITYFQGEEYDDIKQNILESLENFQKNGWTFKRVIQLGIHIDMFIDFPIIQKSEWFSIDTMVTFYYNTINAFIKNSKIFN